MSYEVLARKWRPQTFDEVIGQDHITRTLKKAVEAGRLSHAYLFSGPRGCGKTSTARILAKVINCTNLQGGNPCNQCPSCVGVIQGRNLDVMEIDGASHTGVNEVRDLQESLGYAPSQYRNKVYIIDEVHMLSTHAFNALLKTLEEPPSHVYFVFATTAPNKIPDTIKSRCQRHQFKRLEISEIVDHLETICGSEKVQREPEALRLLARKAEGSMRDAESLLDQCITASGGSVTAGAVRDVLGLLDQELVLAFVRTISERDSTAVLQRLDRAIHEGVDLEELLNAMIEGFRDLMLLASPGDLTELIFRSSEEIESLRELVAAYQLPDLVTIVERLCNVAPRLRTASDPRILMESVLVDLALVDRQTDIRELIDRLQRSGVEGGGNRTTGRRETSSKPRSDAERESRGAASHLKNAAPGAFTQSPVASPPSADAAPPGADAPRPPESTAEKQVKDVDLASLGYAEQRKLWEGFVTFVRQKKVALGVCLISGTLKSIDEQAVLLRFAKGFGFQKGQVEEAANTKFLKGMMKKYFGRDLELFCFHEGDDARAEREKLEHSEQPNSDSTPKRSIETKPIVKKILTDFDGEIVRYHPQ
jgi:DNA polymerase-3 subunit gamma/tau